MKKRVLIFLAVIASIFAINFSVFSDFGDFSGDSDYGSDYSSDYDSDSSSSSWSSDSYTYNDTSSSVDDDDLSFSGYLTIFLIALVLYFIFSGIGSKNNNKGKKRPVAPGATPTPQSSLKPMTEYLKLDATFDAGAFKDKLSNLYVQFQQAWQAKDMTSLRPYLADTIYNQCDLQLNTYKKNKQTNYIERICVLGVELKGWKTEGENDVIVAQLRTRIVDYVKDDKTDKVIRGDASVEKFMTYEWMLTRKHGSITANSEGTTVQKCPNCGAPININQSAKCEYCGAIMNTDNFDWVVSNIKGLSQRTGN